MNICIVNERFYMQGGVGRVTIELANNLAQKGYKVTLVDFSGKNKFYYSLNSKVSTPPVIKKRNNKRRIIGKLLQIKHAITKNSISSYLLYKEQVNDLITHLKQSKYDIVILCQGLLTSFIPKIKNEIPNITLFAWQHNQYDIYVNKYYKKYIDDFIYGVKQADQIICLTEADQKHYLNLNDHSTFIYNPLTITNDHKIYSNLDKKNIVFVGRLIFEQKGLDYLIEIAKNIKDGWRILIAGDGPDKEKFMELIKLQHLEEKIIVKGGLDTKDLIELYLSSSIFISTSRWEGFGLVITEAMAFGLPIISFDNHGPREILKHGEYGILIEKADVQEFTSKLNKLTESQSTREKYQRKSLERVKDFESELITKKWEELFLRFH